MCVCVWERESQGMVKQMSSVETTNFLTEERLERFTPEFILNTFIISDLRF